MNMWVAEAIHKIEADYHRSADTHLIRLDVPKFQGIHLYLKDESTHPTGSLSSTLLSGKGLSDKGQTERGGKKNPP